MSKSIHTLVDDVYRLMETKEAEESVDVEAEIEKFGEAMKSLMRTEFARDRKKDTRTLRLSNIGRDDRYLWNVANGTDTGEKIKPHTYVKFMYGHVIEEMLRGLGARVKEVFEPFDPERGAYDDRNIGHDHSHD